MTRAKITSLQLIDEILGALSQGGLGEGDSFRASRKAATSIRRFASFLGVEESLPRAGEFTLGGGMESWKSALFYARSYIEVLADSWPKFFSIPIEDQMVFFKVAREWPESMFVKYAKYTTAWPMARFLSNPLPERPEGFLGSPLFSGKVKRFLKSRIVSQSNVWNARLFFGILQGVKRGCEPVSEHFVFEAMLKHRKGLSEAPRGIEPDEDHHMRYEEFFSGYAYPRERLHEPSSAASYQEKRSFGGAREFIRSQQPEGLIKMYEYRPGQVEEVRGRTAPSFIDAVNEASQSSRKVMVSAILEPLKVRLITKGDSYRYWISRYYQKALWKHLQTFPQFVATGRPLVIRDFEDVKAREKELGLDFPLWVSGDYSAATDSLDIRHTKAAFEASLRKGLFSGSPQAMDVLRSVLYEQEIYYPERLGIDPVLQTTGQLMGSTLSFPILCTVNLVAYWRSLERYLGRHIKIRDLPVLVNGDDILFRANPELYDLWQSEVKSVGFELSLGKNYVHRRYFTINSQLYSDTASGIQRHGFLNAGLLTGQSKITGRENAKLAPIWDYYNEVVHSAVNPRRAHNRFIHYHRSKIESLTQKGNYNLFLPFERGGLGFLPFPGMMPRVTSFQRRFATYLENRFVKDPSVINKISLVSGKNWSRLVLHHEPKVVTGPKIGPLPKGVAELQEREVSLPPLARLGEVPERPELRVRLPRPRTIRQFREGTFRRMGGQVFSFPWKPYEDISSRLPDESEAEFVCRASNSRLDYIGWECFSKLSLSVAQHELDCPCWTCQLIRLNSQTLRSAEDR
jgi:hypothetical protein